MGSIEHRPDRPKPYRARYWGPDGKQHRRSFARKSDAERWLIEQEAAKLRNTWANPSGARRRFGDWAGDWWKAWSANPDLSPHTLEMAESRLRVHLQPYFGFVELGAITVRVVDNWQRMLAATVGRPTVVACRSLLNRILQAAVDDRCIPINPVAQVKLPKRRVDPNRVFGRVRRRAFTPAEFGRFLAACPPFWRDHFLVQVGTGLRPGELLGLHASGINLPLGRIEVEHVRYDAGRFGSGYKNRPKSDASIRPIPMAPLVVQAILRRLDGCSADGLVFCGPGGSNHVPRGVRSKLSVGNYRRVYDQTIARTPGLDQLDLHGPHDLRHTFATWLEEAGIPARVIDELMGHRGGQAGQDVELGGSAVGLGYRHTTPEMQARVLAAVDERLAVALAAVPQACPKGSR